MQPISILATISKAISILEAQSVLNHWEVTTLAIPEITQAVMSEVTQAIHHTINHLQTQVEILDM